VAVFHATNHANAGAQRPDLPLFMRGAPLGV
jgi:hypothetical protein